MRRKFVAVIAGAFELKKPEVVPASELNDALEQIRELQRLLGKKTMENEIRKEAVEVMK